MELAGWNWLDGWLDGWLELAGTGTGWMASLSWHFGPIDYPF
jgi:hypothetical protein